MSCRLCNIERSEVNHLAGAVLDSTASRDERIREVRDEGRTFPSFVIRRAAEKPVPVTANMTVRRLVNSSDELVSEQCYRQVREMRDFGLIIPKGTRASKGTGCSGREAIISIGVT